MKILSRGTSEQKKEYCLIGLNKFNLEIAKKLVEEGHRVTGLDNDPKVINLYGGLFDYVINCDVTNINDIKKIGVESFDYVVIGITDIGTSVMAATNLKEVGVEHILCKAKDDSHRRILKFLGVTTAYIPEEEISTKVTYKLIHDLNVESFSISSEHEDALLIKVPLNNPKLVGKEVKDVDDIRTIGAVIISIKRENEKPLFPVNGAYIFQQGDIVSLICKSDSISKIKDIFGN